MSLSSFLARVVDQVPASNNIWVIVIGVIATVAVAIVGAIGTVAAAWLQGTRTQRQATAANQKAEEAQVLAGTVAESVGPKNDHGTVQDATKLLIGLFEEHKAEVALKFDELTEELTKVQENLADGQQALLTSVQSVVTAADGVNARLKIHDLELGQHRKRIDAIEASGTDTTP